MTDWWGFNVVLLFPDGSSHYEARDLEAEDAVKLAKRCTERPAAMAGLIQRVIITDDGDNTCFEWIFNRGV